MPFPTLPESLTGGLKGEPGTGSSESPEGDPEEGADDGSGAPPEAVNQSFNQSDGAKSTEGLWRRRESNSSGNFNKALEFRAVSLSDEFIPVVHRVPMNTSSCGRVRRGLGT